MMKIIKNPEVFEAIKFTGKNLETLQKKLPHRVVFRHYDEKTKTADLAVAWNWAEEIFCPAGKWLVYNRTRILGVFDTEELKSQFSALPQRGLRPFSPK